MKNKLMMVISVFVLLLLAVGIGGFIVFNKRLAESKAEKERQDAAVEREVLNETGTVKKTPVVLEQTFRLQILSPSDGSTVTSPNITFRGNTVAQAEVFVNDKEVIADAEGNFSLPLTLEEGDNPIMVVANDAEGNVSEAEIVVIYEAGE